MSVDYIKRALSSVRHPVSSSLSLPPACYHDESWYQHEIDQLFRKGWFCIGRADRWQKPGDFEAINVSNIPVVIILDSQGDLQAMSNTCLHRSSEIMSGAGSCKVIVCPFHGWSYDFAGKVISAPRMETAECFKPDQLQLKQFYVAQQDGFVFISLSDSVPAIEEWLGDFSDVHHNWELSNLVTARSRQFDVDCNWKLFIEVFNEYYHLPYVHPDSIGHYYPEPDPTDDVIGEYTSQFGLTTANPALLEDSQDQSLPIIASLDDKQKNGTRYTWCFPNMTFAASSDCLWMYHVYPLNSKTTRVVQTVCFPEESCRQSDFTSKSSEYYKRFDIAIDEDVPALEKQQSGIESPFALQGRFSTLEPSVGNFACWYSEKLSV